MRIEDPSASSTSNLWHEASDRRRAQLERPNRHARPPLRAMPAPRLCEMPVNGQLHTGIELHLFLRCVVDPRVPAMRVSGDARRRQALLLGRRRVRRRDVPPELKCVEQRKQSVELCLVPFDPRIADSSFSASVAWPRMMSSNEARLMVRVASGCLTALLVCNTAFSQHQAVVLLGIREDSR